MRTKVSLFPAAECHAPTGSVRCLYGDKRRRHRGDSLFRRLGLLLVGLCLCWVSRAEVSDALAHLGRFPAEAASVIRANGNAADSVAALAFTPAAGSYNGVINVSISGPVGSKIYYTTDGSRPTTASRQYDAPIKLLSTTTVKAVAVDAAGRVGDVVEAVYEIARNGSGEGFNPANPADPGVLFNLTCEASPAAAGYVSPNGRQQYKAGENVRCQASTWLSGFRFVHWLKGGEVVSESPSFTYVMPEAHVTLTAVFAYDPDNPADPDSMGLRHKVYMSVSPENGGSVSPSSGTSYEEGQTFTVVAYNHSNFVFKGWQQDGRLVSTQKSFSVKMGDHDLFYTALFEYRPDSPAEPSLNSWNAGTGELIVDRFSVGGLSGTINGLVSNRALVKTLIVGGEVNQNDCRAFSGFTNGELLDVSRTAGLTALPGYFVGSGSAFRQLILPASVTSVSDNAFYYASALESLTLYALTPPTLSGRSLSGLPAGVKIYVPPTSVSGYAAAEGWSDYTILPIQGHDFAPVIENVSVTRPATAAEDWNDFSAEHPLRLSGRYMSASGYSGAVYYSVDNGAWALLADGLDSGSDFEQTVSVRFSAGTAAHTVRLYARDEKDGRSSDVTFTYRDAASLLVSGLSDSRYDGTPVEFADLYLSDPVTSARLVEGEDYTLSYAGNINAGTATLNIAGVFPYSIGHAAHHFKILAATLKGEILVEETVLKYDGQPKQPKASFLSYGTDSLTEGEDFMWRYENNVYPGMASVIAEGIGNYTGRVTRTFEIEKAKVDLAQLKLVLPPEDILYDGLPHKAQVEPEEGMGIVRTVYRTNGTEAEPVKPGTYVVSLDVSDGEYFSGARFDNVGTFTITALDGQEWEVLKAFRSALDESEGWTVPWNITDDVASAGTLHGLRTRYGHVVALTLPENGLKGELPGSIFTLPQLQRLDLSGNRIRGDVGKWLDVANESLEALNLSRNELSGNIGQLASMLPALVSLKVADNGLEEVRPVLSEKIDTLDLSRQNPTLAVTLDWRNLTAEKFLSAMPSICLYNHDQRGYMDAASFGMADALTEATFAVTAKVGDGTVLLQPEAGKQVYKGDVGSLVYLTNPSATAANSVIKVKLDFMNGDADFSGEVNVLDLQSIINAIFKNMGEAAFNHTAANLYKDELINVQDVVAFIDVLLSQPSDTAATAAQSALRAGRNFRQTGGTSARLYVENGRLILDTDTPVAALDVTVENCPGGQIIWDVEKYGLVHHQSSEGGRSRTVLYSLTGGTLPAGSSVIARLSARDARVAAGMLSDRTAKAIPVAFDHLQTGLSTIGADGCAVRLSSSGVRIVSEKALQNVTLRICGVDGRVVAKYHWPLLSAGVQTLPLRLQPGVYVVNMDAAGQCLSQKTYILSNK